MKRDTLRTVRFRPYRKGCGPSFTLQTWYTGRTISGGKDRIGYELRQHDARKTRVIFSGEDFGNSPLDAIDSDESIKGLMSFLTLRKGDTDAEYFADYTAEQLEFSEQHAEALAAEVYSRFGE